MEYEFHWVSNTANEIKNSAEANIRRDQGSVHPPITFCHGGTVIVTLSSPDLLQMTLVGNMKCSCGKVRGEITGSSDGANLNFKAIED